MVNLSLRDAKIRRRMIEEGLDELLWIELADAYRGIYRTRSQDDKKGSEYFQIRDRGKQ